MGWTDEVMISNVARNADWARTAYNNQNSPTTFYTAIGTEEAAPAFAVDFLGGRALKLPNGQVLLGWETGLERDTLGFQVVREQGGVFSQLTKDLVEGSLLRAMVGGNGNSPYFWLDPTGWGAGPVRYFVDDVDAQGVTTRHGPFAPSAPSGSADESLMSVWRARQQPEPVLASQPMSLATDPVSALDAGADFAPVARSMEVAPVSGPPLIKLGVLKAGWQRVTGADLYAQGFPLVIPSNQIALWKNGADISRVITDGGDGTFDADDTLEFWGLGEPGIYANEFRFSVRNRRMRFQRQVC
ncbi:MAG: hypothetical protein SFV15_01155 [Polyangiaceae bacterium]|nr:hypothetical protein [Polyangiaceae bacterium]